MSPNNNKINNLLDSLYLELLDLIEQYIQCRVNIERLTNSGQLLLAKTRYVQGTQAVSTAYIPTERSEDFTALCRVIKEDSTNTVCSHKSKLLRYDVNKTEGFIEPMNWFSILASSSLRNAADHFKRSLPLIVEGVNIQREMLAIMDSIEHLKVLKLLHPH